MNRARIYVVRTFRDADLLCSALVKADRRAELLDQALLLGEGGGPLFPGYVAGVTCIVSSKTEAGEVDKIYQACHVEAMVLDRELSSQDDTGMERLVSVFHVTNSLQADLLKNLLAERGIEAVVANDSIQSGVSAITGQTLTSVVLVAQRYAESAREIVEQIASGEGDLQSAAFAGDDEGDEESNVINAWPTCPDCRRPRTTVCPICETSGDEFPRADDNFLAGEEADPSRLPVICTTCDEPWLAEFLRCCEWCNHDFGKGLSNVFAAPVNLNDREINSRAGMIILAMGAIFLGLMIYFTVITSR